VFAETFEGAAQAIGLRLDRAVADGEIHRCAVADKPHGRPGWYVLHRPPIGRAFGAFGRWDQGAAHHAWTEGGASSPPSDAERAAIAAAKRSAADRQRRGWQRTAERARALWEAASPAPADHPYLRAKAIPPGRFRQLGERLLVSLRDADRLWSVQTIAPDGEKRFLTGGRVEGCWSPFGELKGAPTALICEGAATAATLHAATGYPVAAAMHAGNLAPVARALRRLLGKEARLLICGDDDRDTAARTGSNPGAEAAPHAARACSGRWCLPADLPEGRTDFNDLAQAVGLDAVREQIEAALAGKAKAPKAERAAIAPSAETADHFRFDPTGGVFHDAFGAGRVPFCSPIEVAALTRDQDGAEWGYLLRLTDPEGAEHRFAVPARLMAGDGAELRALLLSFGLRIAPGAKARALLGEYLATRAPRTFARCTDRTGWHGRAFVLADRTLGAASEEVIFQSAGAVPNAFRSAGSAAEWRERVGKFCRGNSRLLFAVSVALAGPLLFWVGADSFAVHLRGPSSSGKTTGGRVAASVWGPPADFVQTWRSTANAIEGMCASHSDALLVLDEIAELDPREMVATAYAVGNGTGKARLHRTGVPRERLRWRVAALSTGELSIEQHAASAGKRTTAGAEARAIDLPGDGLPFGIFEELNGYTSGDAFARHLAREVGEVYGTVGPAWVERIAEAPEQLAATARAAVAAFVKAQAGEGAAGQVARVAARFGLVAFAGEAATEAGLTGWHKNAALGAARQCFRAWLDARGGAGNLEERQILQAVRAFLQAHGESRCPWLHRSADDHRPDKPLRIGYRVLMKDGERVRGVDDFTKIERGFAEGLGESGTELHYWIWPEVFRNEVCAGLDHRFASRLLLARGWLRGERDGERVRPDRRESSPLDGKARFYCFTPAAMSEDF
jgi:putative DNA primase/helicase